MLLGAGFVVAAEIEDSNLFVEAFSAYQNKDYLLAIEKIAAIQQVFPDTPLRDVALLLLARSALKSGDNELAAKTIVQFNREFPASPLKSSAEEELQRLGIRWQKGERLQPAIPLRTAARKVRNEQVALGRSATEMVSQQKLEQEPIRVSIRIPVSVKAFAVGQRGEIPFEVVNLGATEEGFVLEASAPPEYETMLAVAGQADEKSTPVSIASSAPCKGSIKFRMPTGKIDGHKATISLRAVSKKSMQVVQTLDTLVITAAPLVRVVAKPEKQKLAPGEQTRYHITVLNAGTLPALELTARVILPAQIEFLKGTGVAHQEAAGDIIFNVDALDTGNLAEFTMNVKVREDCPIGQELHSKVEVVHNQLQTKETFTSVAVVVQAK
jgi:uncharacterized repeat protein (TIGR01451 family)